MLSCERRIYPSEDKVILGRNGPSLMIADEEDEECTYKQVRIENYERCEVGKIRWIARALERDPFHGEEQYDEFQARQHNRGHSSAYLTNQLSIKWGRTGRMGYHYHYHEDSEFEDEEDLDSQDEESWTQESRWPDKVKHKGGSPYVQPIDKRYRARKHEWNKRYKRNSWRHDILDSLYDYEQGHVVKRISLQKIQMIQPVEKRIKRKKTIRTDTEIEQIREARKEGKEKDDTIPPFIGDNSLGESLEHVTQDSALTDPPQIPVMIVPESKDLKSEMCDTVSGRTKHREDDSLLVKLLRESTRPDILHMEFRHDYREADCKPRRFVLNMSRIVFHHMTLMNRLRLRSIPKLDLSTYLVFAYCGEHSPGVDLYRVWVASTWAGVGKRAKISFDAVQSNKISFDAVQSNKISFDAAQSNKISLDAVQSNKAAQIQELIQCVVSAIDKVENRRLVSTDKKNRRGFPKISPRPASNFSVLTSVMKWDIDIKSAPRASEWQNSHLQSRDSVSTNIFSTGHNPENTFETFEPKVRGVDTLNIRRGPSEPSMCGSCLQEYTQQNASHFLALSTCSHWFCESCWKSRLLRQKQKSLVCVEEGCTNILDQTTLITLLRIDKIRKMNEKKLRQHVLSLAPLVIPCPNTECGHILSITKPDNSMSSEMPVVVTCRCSRQFCFNCFKSPHWPVSCEAAERYSQFLKQHGDEESFSRLLEDREFPNDLLSGRRCSSCGRFMKYVVMKNAELTELRRPLCIQCAKENQLRGPKIDPLGSILKISCVALTDHNGKQNMKLNNLQSLPGSDSITKWYKIACAHRKMRHPEVVKTMYMMAETVVDKLIGAVAAKKHVGDPERAAKGWEDCLLEWAEEYHAALCDAKINISTDDDSGMECSERQTSVITSTSTRSPSACSDLSSLDDTISHEISPTLTRLQEPTEPAASEIPAAMTRAACNIVQHKLELHQIAEYTAVLLDYEVAFRGKLVRCLERCEDLCTSLGILLQDPHIHNAGRILPTFMRLRVQTKHAIENIRREVSGDHSAPCQ